MPTPTDPAEVRTMIERFTAWDQEPALTSDEVDSLVALARGQIPWAAETDYALGVEATDAALTGRFAIILPGVSGTTEPDWTADLIQDGTAQWAYAGDPTYDLYGAAGIGWDWKAAKVAGRYDLSRAGQSWTRSQQWQHCVRMAAYYRGLGNGELAGGAGGVAAGVGRPGSIEVAPPQSTYPVYIGPASEWEDA